MILKCDSSLSLPALTQSLLEKGYSWVTFEDYLVNKTD